MANEMSSLRTSDSEVRLQSLKSCKTVLKLSKFGQWPNAAVVRSLTRAMTMVAGFKKLFFFAHDLLRPHRNPTKLVQL